MAKNDASPAYEVLWLAKIWICRRITQMISVPFELFSMNELYVARRRAGQLPGQIARNQFPSGNPIQDSSRGNIEHLRGMPAWCRRRHSSRRSEDGAVFKARQQLPLVLEKGREFVGLGGTGLVPP